MGIDDFSNSNHPPSPPRHNYNSQTSISENNPPSAAMSTSNYPDPEMNRPMHVSPYSPPPARTLQPYALPPQQQQQHQHEQSQDNYSPAQNHQQYSYDIQLRYPAPSPSFPTPSMAGRYEPARDLPAPLPSMTTIQAGGGFGPPMEMNVDTTGQMPPPGVKPRVTATLWEDEGTLCFQVDVKGTCVARREDNHMINGTKLLNVVGMTRGRRDGILKSEKQKHVVKIGPMHLKGVWIPYERALEFANKEHITELLYPLFVHNIGALLHHPVNHHPAYRTSSTLSTPANMYPPPPNPAQIPRTHDFPPPLPSLQQGPMSPMSPPDYGRQTGPIDYGREQQRQQGGQGGPGGQGQFQSDQGGALRPIYS